MKNQRAVFREKFLNRKLSYKISAATGILLACFLTVLIIISASIAGSFLSKSIKSEFEGVAAQNGVVVQNVLTTASDTAQILQDYIVEKYDEFEKTATTVEPPRAKSTM